MSGTDRNRQLRGRNHQDSQRPLRRNAMRMTSVMLCVLAAILQLSACGAAPPSPGLRLAIAGDPSAFDPLKNSDENSGVVMALTGGTLLRIDPLTDEVHPELAESWT